MIFNYHFVSTNNKSNSSNSVETTGLLATAPAPQTETAGSLAFEGNKGNGMDSFAGKDIFGDFSSAASNMDGSFFADAGTSTETAGALACADFADSSFDGGFDGGGFDGGFDGGCDCGGGFTSVC